MHASRSRVITISGGLAAAALMATSACSRSPSSGSTGSASSGSTKDFTVGVRLTLSGPEGPVGQLLEQGINLWAKEYKTIDGRPVTFTYADDQGNANGGAAAARKLTSQDHVDAILGPFDTDAATGALPITDAAKIIEVPLTAYQPAHLPSQFPYSFPLQYSDSEAGTLAIIGAQAVHSKKLAILSVASEFGTSTQTAVLNAAKEAHIDVVSTQEYPDNATDLSTELSKAEAAGADAIIVNSLVNSDYRLIFTAMAALDYRVPVIGGSPAADPSVVASIPAAYRQYLWVTSAAAAAIKPVTPQVQQFVQQWTRIYGKVPITNVSTLGASYDAMSFLRWAFSGPDDSSADKVENFVVSTNNFVGVQGKYTFTSQFRVLLTDQAGTAQAASFDGGTFTGVK